MKQFLCDYGCGQFANYEFKNGKHCCSSNVRKCPAIKNKRLSQKDIYSNMSKESKGRMNWNKGKHLKDYSKVFCKNSLYSTHTVRKYLKELNLKEYKCEICGIIEWNKKPISLQLHHIDGDRTNNSLNNLQFLCPNCHSQTKNFGSKNKTNNCKNISEEQKIEAYKKYGNIRQALNHLGLTPKGGNYDLMYRLVTKYNLHEYNKIHSGVEQFG